MEEVSSGEEMADQAVNLNDRIDKVAKYVLGQTMPVRVVDDEDSVVGVLHQAHVLAILYP